MIKSLKEILHNLKKGTIDLFRYPVVRLRSDDAVDYDEYWSERRAVIGEMNAWQRERARLTESHVKKWAKKSLLDVGCGAGGVLLYLKNKYGIAHVIGVDISEPLLVKLREMGVDGRFLDLSDKHGLASLPEADIILVFEVLEHVANAEELMKIMYRKAQHSLCISVPNSGYIEHRLRLLLGKFPLQWRLHPGEHLRFWTLADMVWWLDVLGLRDRARVVGYRGIPVLNKIWPNLFAAGIFVYLSKGGDQTP